MEINKPKKFKLSLKPEEKWFKDFLNILTESKTPDYPNSIFYLLGSDVFMEYNKETKELFFSYQILPILELDFNLSYQQIQGLVKGVVEKHYELGSVAPRPTWQRINEIWKDITVWDY